ncbi:sensor histidine kinase [Photobacterium swingsii]|uniref:sensor histidine kinase n=1 Tax=Photobacterium swingsii TaxID=680026 RepID=UPI00354AD7AF
MAKATDSKHKVYPSLYRKLVLTFSILTLVLVTVFWAVIYKAEEQMEIISLHHWLDTEAKRYQRDYVFFGEETIAPNTAEFSSFWSERPHPTWLNAYQKPGYFKHFIEDDDKHFVVIKHPSGIGFYYIVFNDYADDYLDDYEDSLHFYTILLGGIATLLALCYGLYFVRLLAKPLSQIEEKIERLTPDTPGVTVTAKYKELRRIEESLLQSKLTTDAYFKREQEFHQFASHELRTPLMVMSGSIELLARLDVLPTVGQKAVARLQQASHDMELMTDTLLLLGVEQIEPHHYQSQSLSFALEKQVHLLSALFSRHQAALTLTSNSQFTVNAPASFVTVVINNLIKNAHEHGSGTVNISLNNDTLKIQNAQIISTPEYSQSNSYGYGLVIIRRICERMGWPLDIKHNPDSFIVSVKFAKQTTQAPSRLV